MKKLIEACGEPVMAHTDMPEASQGSPVQVNVTMNATGADNVADLINIMKNAGVTASPVSSVDVNPMRHDIEKFRSAVDDDPAIPGKDDVEGDSDLNAGILGTLAGGILGTAAGAATGATGALASGGAALGAKAGSGIAGALGKGMMGKLAGGAAGAKIGSAVGSALPSAAGAAIGDKVTNDESIDDDEDENDDLFKDDEFTAMDQEDDDEVNKHFKDDTQYSIKGKSEEANAKLARAAGQDAEVEEWANSAPGAEREDRGDIGDYEDNIHDGNDLHKQKKSYKAAAGGDNAMSVESIRATLMKALTEKKAKPDFLDVDKDGDKKEPMKKALKDKGSKPKKGKVPPQFQKEEMAAEGRGKVMAGKGRGKKPKLMAGRGRGK